MARILKENTATRITVGPFLDVGDGFTPELALTVTGIHLTLCVDDAGVPALALDADATASAGVNDMVHITNDNAGFYDLELTAANVNYTGRAILACIDDSEHLPVFHEFQIVSALVYDSLWTDGDTLDVNVTAMAAGTVTAGAIAAAAIDNATFAADVGDTAYATNIIALAVRKALDEIHLDHLMAVSVADEIVDDSVIADLTSVTGDWSTFTKGTDSLEAIANVTADTMPKTNTDLANVQFLMVLASDHVSAATGLTPVMTRSIDGAAFGAKNGSTTIAEVASGMYQVDLNAADCNGTIIVYRMAVATADDTFFTIRYRT